MGAIFNCPNAAALIAPLLLLLLLPLSTMAMEGGLRKGDAHGVPGKTMLFGNRPVPLQPGVNAAPKPPNIKIASSAKDRIQSLLVDESGGTSKGENRQKSTIKGVPSLLDGGGGGVNKRNKGKVPSLLERKEPKLAQSLLGDDQVEYLALKIPTNEEEEAPSQTPERRYLKKKHAYKYLKVFLDWFRPPFSDEQDTILARLNQTKNWRNMFLEQLFGVGVRLGSFSVRPPSGNKLIDHIEAQFNELERYKSKELSDSGKTALAVWILFGPATEILKAMDNHNHPWRKSYQCERCQMKEATLMSMITAKAGCTLDELAENVNGLRVGIERELKKIDKKWTAQNMDKFEQSWASFRRSVFHGHESSGGSGGQTFRRGVASLLS